VNLSFGLSKSLAPNKDITAVWCKLFPVYRTSISMTVKYTNER
jgi:hypothetical protein